MFAEIGQEAYDSETINQQHETQMDSSYVHLEHPGKLCIVHVHLVTLTQCLDIAYTTVLVTLTSCAMYNCCIKIDLHL